MNTQKLAQAFLQLSQALATVHEALLEGQPGATQVPSGAPPVATQVPSGGPPVATQVPSGAPPVAGQNPDQFLAFADQLKSIIQTVPPGALNAQISQILERYVPGAAGQGQGGIRKLQTEQYASFLNEVRQAAAALGGAPQ